MELRTFTSDAELATAAAADWVRLLQSNARYTVALSGGRIAKAFYQNITAQARGDSRLLANVDFFWADERCVPPNDPESNFYLANEHLFQPLNIEEFKIHRLKGEIAPNLAVADANAEISRIAPHNEHSQPVLDLVILGMGEDGHVASLFPNTRADATSETSAPYLFVPNSPKPPPHRLSLSYAAIAAAKDVWVLASGAGKQAALKESLSQTGATPLGRVLKSRPKTTIFTDVNV